MIVGAELDSRAFEGRMVTCRGLRHLDLRIVVAT
jgi:hypothetical protein